MQRLGTRVSLKLHETVIMPTLLYGCETWTLDSKEMSLVERTDLWTLKKLFGLPPTTPTPAVRFITGTLYMNVRIGIKQLIYLQQLLRKEDDQWIRDALMTLKEDGTGWAKTIRHTLEQWELESDWEINATESINTRKREVHQAAEKYK